ncbi:MAG: DJ-1/PfpI family protein [Sneathiella sp.]
MGVGGIVHPTSKAKSLILNDFRDKGLVAVKKIGALIFQDFDLLDLFGPLEFFGMFSKDFDIQLIAEKKGNVRSAQGPSVTAEAGINNANDLDFLLIPGGPGTRCQVNNQTIIDWITSTVKTSEIVMTVCTGTALLARSGALKGISATTNKKAYNWVCSQSNEVNWVSSARWVEDGKYYTSSGVSAGMDMSLAVIGNLLGKEKARQASIAAEYDWHENSEWDPFAKIYGL